jgi:hypothetical protein
MASMFHLKKFNLPIIRNARPTCAPIILILGKRGTGKTTLISNILKHQNIPIGVIVAASDSNLTHYHKLKSKINTELIVHEVYSSTLIANVIAVQSVVHKKQKIADKRMVVVFDDSTYTFTNSTWARNKPMFNLVTTCACHLSTMVIFGMSYPVGIPPNISVQIDYIFVFNDANIYNRKRIYNHYFGMIPSFEMFCQIMDACTDDYECLVIDNTVQSNEPVDRLFWYKADNSTDIVC